MHTLLPNQPLLKLQPVLRYRILLYPAYFSGFYAAVLSSLDGCLSKLPAPFLSPAHVHLLHPCLSPCRSHSRSHRSQLRPLLSFSLLPLLTPQMSSPLHLSPSSPLKSLLASLLACSPSQVRLLPLSPPSLSLPYISVSNPAPYSSDHHQI